MIFTATFERRWLKSHVRCRREHLAGIGARGGRRHAGNPNSPGVLALLERNRARVTPCPVCASAATKCNGVHDGIGNHVCRGCGVRFMTVRHVMVGRPD